MHDISSTYAVSETDHALQLFYARGDEAFAPYRPGWNAGKEIAGRGKLGPGEALAHDETFLLFSGGRKFLFTKPGRYRLKAQVSLRQQVIESDAVSILVKPLPPDHVPASQLASDLGVARAFQEWGTEEAAVVTLEKLTADFPHSLYADHAHCALGNYYWGRSRPRYYPPWVDPKPAKKAFERYSAVSARIGAMRARALLRMAELAAEVPEIRPEAKLDDLLRELQGYVAVAEAIGRREEFAALCKKLEDALASARR